MADSSPLDAVVSFFSTLVLFIAYTTWGMIRACLPMGILPRKSVKGEICLITGAGSGLGRLMAQEFGRLGCKMVLWDINQTGNEATKGMLEKQGVKEVYTYVVDVSDRNAINTAAARVKKDIGDVDILINNAGVVTGETLLESPDEAIALTMAVNTNACLYTTKNFLGSMIKKNHGHLVTIASLAGKFGTTKLVDYCASKHGAIGFHESMTEELRRLGATGVKTTVINPYIIDTGMFAGAESKSPKIFPCLVPEYVVECIMEAVLTNKEEIQIPRGAYISNAISSMIPAESKHLLAEYFGQPQMMDNFTGRKKKA